jgi:hypothetical protein
MPGRSPSRHRSKGSTVVFGADHDRYNEEWEVYDRLTRTVKKYNHDFSDANIQLGVLQDVHKNRLYIVVPFTAMQVKNFSQLSRDISLSLGAEVSVSADVDVQNDAQIHFSFNILRDSLAAEKSYRPRLSQNLIIAVLLLLLFLSYYF